MVSVRFFNDGTKKDKVALINLLFRRIALYSSTGKQKKVRDEMPIELFRQDNLRHTSHYRN